MKSELKPSRYGENQQSATTEHRGPANSELPHLSPTIRAMATLDWPQQARVFIDVAVQFVVFLSLKPFQRLGWAAHPELPRPHWAAAFRRKSAIPAKMKRKRAIAAERGVAASPFVVLTLIDRACAAAFWRILENCRGLGRGPTCRILGGGVGNSGSEAIKYEFCTG
jgi:hypothetical protein